MKWLKEEVEFLKKFYPTKSAHELAKVLKRSPEAIQNKAQALGIKSVRRYWSKEEEAVLREHYEKASYDELKEMLPKRSLGAIKKRAQQLGLSREHLEKFNSLEELDKYRKALAEVKDF